MVVNFRICRISRGTRKLSRTPTLNKKKKNCDYRHAIRELIIELREVNSHESLINFIFESVVVVIF